MIATITSCTLCGIDAVVVDVECEITKGLPAYNVVGLAATSVKEGAVRIRSALNSVGADLPLKKVTVNLAPADLKKAGSALDLPVAAAVLIGNEGNAELLGGLMVLGELGLDGSVRPVHGVLAASLLARERGMRGVLVPDHCAGEACVVDDLEVYALTHIRELLSALRQETTLRMPGTLRSRVVVPRNVDMAEVRGQEQARLALEVAVAGGHNLLLAGPPGTGKTMLARRIPTILPPLTRNEAFATTRIYSALGLADGLIEERPFRAPHHSISSAALLGGGSPPRPGEISLAHNGILFLDELPEFARAAVEGLREPLEERAVTINRIAGSITLPASFLLIAAANPCPCGWYDSKVRECTCSSAAIARYHARLSGPLMDRIDLQTFVPPVSLAELRDDKPGESSASIRERVTAARDRQRHRLAPWGLNCNAEMTTTIMRATCKLDASAEVQLGEIVRARKTFTARSIDRLLKVARTVADLLGQDEVDAGALREASVHRDVDPVADVMPDRPKGGKRRRGMTPQEILAKDQAKYGDAERAVLESVAAAALAKATAATPRTSEERPVILVADRPRARRRTTPVAAKSLPRPKVVSTDELDLTTLLAELEPRDPADTDDESPFASVAEFEKGASVASEPAP